MGVLCGGFGGKMDGDSWFTWQMIKPPGPSIRPKRTLMIW